MAVTLEDLAARVEALERAQTATPVSYYTSRYSGEEMDERLDAVGVLGGTPQQALANLGAGVHSNKLVNGGFWVNQRNWKSVTAETFTQRIHDMWELSWTPGVTGSAEALDGGGVKITSSSVIGNNPGGVLINRFEGAINGKWTLSVFVKIDSLPVGSNIAIQIANDTKKQYPGFSIAGALAVIGKYAIYSLTADISGWEDSDSMRVSVYNYGGPATFSVNFVKLEPGAFQTAGYQDDSGTWQLLPQSGTDYATQLMKCHRYLTTFESITMCPGGVEGDDLIFGVNFPTEMRVAPTFIPQSGGNNLQLYVNGSAGFYPNVEFSLQWVSQTGATIKCASPIELSPQTSVSGRIDGKLMFSAEL